MPVKDILISLIAICIVVIVPHTELIPNFGYSVPILLFVWLCLKYFGEQFVDIGFSFKSFKFKAILIGSLAALFIVFFMQFIFFPVLEYFVVFEETDVELYDFIRKSKWNYLFIIIMGWLVGGLYEEIVFHGFIFSRLEKMIPGKNATPMSFIITSIIFGAYHYQLGTAGLINALIVGAAYLGIVIYFKRNLWYAIICHGVHNTIIVTLIYMNYL
ncbi:MAG: type II CAAX endopeptidase family protein [Saprospiraceae bacterium]|nr:type II CAAX endopeptidase family protein [Saprospiraceae bacterium]|tara:strand:+ start:162 stop:806 length:645 start_codon:yes stop_codon:yes gene_type:complete